MAIFYSSERMIPMFYWFVIKRRASKVWGNLNQIFYLSFLDS